MNWQEVFTGAGITVLALSTIGFLAKDWISARLTASITAEYTHQLEQFKQTL